MEQTKTSNNFTDIIKLNNKVSGMTCASCAVSLESYLKSSEGVLQVSVNYPNQSVAINYDNSIISIETIQEKAKEIGYNILIGGDKETLKSFKEVEENRLRNLKSKLIYSSVFSIPVFIGVCGMGSFLPLW